jgi:hypothetical protein
METQKWIQELDRVTLSIKNEFGGLSDEQLNWKPNASTWSIGQIIDHLFVINKTYFPIFNQLRNNEYQLIWLGKINFLVRFFGNLILKSVNPDEKKKMKTLPIWEPSTSKIETDIVQRFTKQQEELKNYISNSSALLDAGTVISSPANRVIVYKLETAFDIIVSHEKRHLEQARRLMHLRKKA